MPDREHAPERDLEQELRELGTQIEHPPTPGLAPSVRSRIDEENLRPARRWPRHAPQWAAAAAVLLLVLAIPAFSPTARDTFSGWFSAAGGAGAGDAAQSGVTRPAEGSANLSPPTTETEDDEPTTPDKTSAAPESAGPIRPGGGGIEASGPSFGTLDQMVATSDLVAIGTVTEVLPGRVIEPETMSPEESYREGENWTEGPLPPPEEPEDDVESYPTRFPVTVVRVDEVLKGQPPEADIIRMETLELAYGGPRDPEWRQPGRRVLLFLSHGRGKKSGDLYFMAGPSFEETAYIIRDRDLVATLRSPLSNRVAKLSLPELRRQVEQAKARISRGEVQPLNPGSMQPQP